VHDLVEGVDPADLAVTPRHGAGTVEFVREDVGQDGVHERGFSRSVHAGDPDEAPQRELRGDVLQVVLPRPAHGDPPVRIGLTPGGRYGNGATAGKVIAGEGILGRQQFLVRAGVRSEERRVGKECRCRWVPYHYKKKFNMKIVGVTRKMRCTNGSDGKSLHTRQV